MRQVVIVSGVLGGGSALVFALAAVFAAAFPTGTLVATSWNGGWQGGGRVLPAFGRPVMVDDGAERLDISVRLADPPPPGVVAMP
jgi:hypothetical protein